ncbi:glycosyltransferase family A protein [Paenibacillus dokdonensis]|uniref:Glycosyltransferase family A protein n=1 Tax=Paenibacillus dokdonensis TaxID=2567944 RepID=A0ABU6GRB5_9BACL|nr:glycosyltransferase family A protein [Paenibacillus dokdonensis]MEC0242285.1 glycosyltransferase family A protein [Paenibacillus dokdonensis]
MMIFVLGADGGSEERTTIRSIAELLPSFRIITVSPGQSHIINDTTPFTLDQVCMTIRAGSRLYPGIEQRIEESIFQLEQVPYPWIHLVPDQEVMSFQSRFRPGEAGPVLWNLRIMAGLGIDFPESAALPSDSLLEWFLMHQMSRSLPGISLESSNWTPSPYKFLNWQRREKEWRKLAPIVCPEAGSIAVPAEGIEPAVTIVLAVFNEPEYLQWAVQSVRSQTSDSWELIMIDDGSTDDTFYLMEKLASEDSARIHILKHVCNQGKAAALNTALQLAHATWLLELDADDWLEPNCIEEISKIVLSLGPDISLLYGNHAEWKQESVGKHSIRGVYRYPVSLDTRTLLITGAPLAPRIFRTEALRKLGGWKTDDPAGGRLYEDMLMIVRMLQQGSSFYLNECLYNRRIRANSITRTHQEHYLKWSAWVIGKYQI